MKPVQKHDLSNVEIGILRLLHAQLKQAKHASLFEQRTSRSLWASVDSIQECLGRSSLRPFILDLNSNDYVAVFKQANQKLRFKDIIPSNELVVDDEHPFISMRTRIINPYKCDDKAEIEGAIEHLCELDLIEKTANGLKLTLHGGHYMRSGLHPLTRGDYETDGTDTIVSMVHDKWQRKHGEPLNYEKKSKKGGRE